MCVCVCVCVSGCDRVKHPCRLTVRNGYGSSPQIMINRTSNFHQSTLYTPGQCYDNIFLSFGSILRLNYLMFSFLEGDFYCAGRSTIPAWQQFWSRRDHSPHEYLIFNQMWYAMARWWKVSRSCFKDWRFYKYLNVSWRSMPDFAGCWFEIPILILNNNQLQLLDGKGIKQQPLIYLSIYRY